MNKIDILIRKINAQYDEEYEMEGIVPTEDDFNQMAQRVREAIHFPYTDEEFIAARDQVRERREASIGIIVSVDKPSDDHDIEWFSKFKEEHPDRNLYNNRFEYFMQEEKHWPEESVKELGRNTDEIVNRLGDPNKAGPWKRKGLVIGDVQSGKTANYTSVCNKAVDAGYKIIIVLAGRTNTLRRQTQKRLESDFVGLRKDDANQKKGEILPTIPVGVHFYGDVSGYSVESITTNVTDFSKKVADSRANSIDEHMRPYLFVVKKVKSVLDNLADWLGGKNQNILNVPMLLIDDEADDASVNTKTADSPTTINACIRRILRLFSRSTYLGVTATPFANILIDPYIPGTETIDPDLFPEDFICCLPTPDLYVGSEKMFREEHEIKRVIPIEANDVKNAFPFKHKKTQEISTVPESLKTAIRYYAVTNAVRDIIGHSKTHRSMMINISRFVDVQNRLKNRVFDFWNDEVMLYIKSYSMMGDRALEYKPIQQIKKVFDDSKVEKYFGISWTQIQAHLYEANSHVSIVAVNQKSSDSLDYERYEKENNDGMRVIAIGGDCLSRGLTLEGLCVSYFYRNSQMYDTLMQMGRWFGFRDGYDKLVRVWMASDAVAWYTHISEATEQLKLEVHRMNRGKLTPMEFGYKIMGHPDSLIPTARAKMKNARLDVQYAEIDVSGHLIESPRLYNRIQVMKANEDLVNSFIKKAAKYGTSQMDGDVIIRGIKAGDVAALIAAFKTKLWHFYFEGASLADGIRESDEEWNVVIKNGRHPSSFTVVLDDGQKINIGAQTRTSTWDKDEIKVSGSKVKVGTGGCTAAGLPDGVTMKDVSDEWKKLPEQYCMKKDKSGYKEIPDEFILHGFVKQPLLLIHNLRIVDDEGKDKYSDNECHVLALGLGFPSDDDYVKSKNEKQKQRKIKVYLNKIAQGLADEEGDDFVDENL